MFVQNLSQIINAHHMPENICITDFEYLIHLTFLVLKLEYTKIHWSISLMLMPWFLVSSGHQQPWYCLCLIKGLLSSTRKDFNNLYHVSIEN